MVKDIKQLLQEKLFTNTDEQKIATVLQNNSYAVDRSHINFHNGIVTFQKIPSSLRLRIIMNKKDLITSLKKEGLYIRDIL